LTQARALKFTQLARQLTLVAGVFLIAALVMGTAGTSYAQSKTKASGGPGLLDTVVVSNNGALFAGSLETFQAGVGHSAGPNFRIHGALSLLGASTGPTGDAVSSVDGHIAVALPTDFLGLTAPALGAPVGCGPFGVPATGPLFGTGLVELFSSTSNGNSAAEAEICSPDFSIGEDGQNLVPGAFPNTTGIFFPQGVAFESPFDGVNPTGHEILAVANEFPEVFGPDNPLAACATTVTCGGPPTPGVSLGTITEYDRALLTPGLNNIPPFHNSPVSAINPFPAMGIPPINPPVGVVYSANATIGGCLSLLAGPVGLAFDQFGYLFAVNNAGIFSPVLARAPRFVTVYGPGASGDSFPVAAIGVPKTDTAEAFTQPISVAVMTGPLPAGCTTPNPLIGCNPDDTIFVTEVGEPAAEINKTCQCAGSPFTCCTGLRSGSCSTVPPSIKVYKPFRDFSPIDFFFQGTLVGTIQGGNTKLKAPEGIALSADADTLYVVNNTANSLSMFTDATTLEGGGNIAPTLIVQSRHAKMNLPAGVALPQFTPTPMSDAR
jgi:hypothetical protein